MLSDVITDPAEGAGEEHGDGETERLVLVLMTESTEQIHPSSCMDIAQYIPSGTSYNQRRIMVNA